MSVRDARWEDRTFVLAEVSKDGLALEHASPALKGDKEVVLAAVSQNGHALEHASHALKGTKEVVRAAVSKDGSALEHASQALQAAVKRGMLDPFSMEKIKIYIVIML